MTSIIRRGLSSLCSHVASQRLTPLRRYSNVMSNQLTQLNATQGISSLHFSNRLNSLSVRSFSSEADREFLKVLTEELQLEKDNMYEIPQFAGGWKESRNGPDCKLTKDYHGDSIQISFNVNGSVPPLQTEDPTDTDEVRAEPDFIVDVKKRGVSEVLTFECYYPNEEPQEYAEKDSNFCIRSVTLHKGEITESTYSFETDHIEPGLYNNLMNFMNIRGIDNIFADELIQYATAVENNCYVEALERLGTFIRQ